MRRPAIHAGRFYPAREDCRVMAEALLAGVGEPPAGPAVIVPHAGWVFSGAAAALGVKALAAWSPETVIVFGAVHGPDPHAASVYPSGEWETPIGLIEVDHDLAARLCRCELLCAAPEQHSREHSIEVSLPFVKLLLPEARVVPINVRPGPEAAAVGQLCAAEARAAGRRVGFMGSTDLTHYGPAFGFESHGRGAVGVRWAKEVNDRRMINLIGQLATEEVIAEATIHRNACGSGAIAATIAAAKELGALRYHELQHTTSAEVAIEWDRDSSNSVGYEAGVFTF